MTEQAKVPAIRFAGFTDPWEQRKLGELSSVSKGDLTFLLKKYIVWLYPVMRATVYADYQNNTNYGFQPLWSSGAIGNFSM